jgi:hypothetical protein
MTWTTIFRSDSAPREVHARTVCVAVERVKTVERLVGQRIVVEGLVGRP